MGASPERILTDLTYSPCNLCPRRCGTARRPGDNSAAGFCGETADIRVAAALLHFGEEPPLTGSGGSGTIFFTGCTLRCSFCQNHQISLAGMGRRVTAKELAEIMLRLEGAGAENINLVTGTHFIPGIFVARRAARSRGFDLPAVWNTSGYETVPAVDALSEMIDIYLPD
ncbi:MAG: radical SAM protein, partial [Spirochaetia bacterium]